MRSARSPRASHSALSGRAARIGGRQLERPAPAEAAVGERERRRSSWWALKSSRNESSSTVLAARAGGDHLLAVQEHADDGLPSDCQSPRVILRPSGRNHQTSGRPQPARLLARQVHVAPEHGVRSAQRDQPLACQSRSSRARRRLPVEPRDLVVLAPGVVVAALRAADARRRRASIGVPCERSSVEQEVPLLARAQHVDLGVVGRALDAAVPRAVVVGAVAPVLLVRLVVLLVVRDEVAQREAVVRGDEVDRGDTGGGRRTRTGRTSRSAGWRSRRRSTLAAPEVAHRCRGRCRSTPTTAPGSCRPGSRPGPTSHGSAISLTWDSTGSWWITSKNADRRSTS